MFFQEIFDQDSTYYSNRAMCYRFEKDWKNVHTFDSSCNIPSEIGCEW